MILIAIAVFYDHPVELFPLKVLPRPQSEDRQELIRLGKQNEALSKQVEDITRRYAEILSPDNHSILDEVNLPGIGGTYLLKSFAYVNHPPPPKLEPTTKTVELKGDSRTVFGVLKSQDSGAEYKLFGYNRIKFLVMAYGGKGALGGGSLALQTEIAGGASLVFWGWRTHVDCVGRESFFVQCPAVMYLQGAQNPGDYAKFLDSRLCRKVTSDKPPELCDDVKANQ